MLKYLFLSLGVLASPGLASDWSIQNHRGGCSMSQKYEDGTVMMIRLDGPREKMEFDFILTNENWASIASGRDYILDFRFDQGPYWKIRFKASNFEQGYPTLMNFESAVALPVQWLSLDLISSEKLDIRFESNHVGQYSLAGSMDAFGEMLTCQSDFWSQPVPPRTSSSHRDPFDPQTH
jgi:hypothetical protein